jgi:hypothetical protein
MFSKIKPFLAMTALLQFAFLIPFVPSGNSYTSYSRLTLNIDGLEDLGDNFMYEGWLIVEGSPVSTGVFSVDENGMLSQTAFFIEEETLEMAEKFVLTIEPYPDNDPSPSATHILAGDFNMQYADLSVADPAALGDDFSASSGSYILATPTNGPNTDENSGIWFLDLTSGSPMQGLFLPMLPDGWKYEGWTVIDGIPVTTGTFLYPDSADEEAPYSGPDPGPPFPGEDFLMNAPSGLTFPTNIAGGTAVISIEPYPDNSEAPFTLKPLVGNIPPNAIDHFTYFMDLNLESLPSGMAMRGEGEISVDMIPDEEPVVVPAGGSFTYTGIVSNNLDEYQNTDIWIMAESMEHGTYGPLADYWDVPLRPHLILGFTGIVQNIPVMAPPGEYEYIAYCGEFNGEMIDKTSFTVTVSDGVGNGATNWDLYGWFVGDGAANPDEIVNVPGNLELAANYPNPFNATTSISFDLPRAGKASLKIYNVAGQLVESLVDGHMDAGRHTVNWDASRYSSGVYFYKLDTAGSAITKRMTLLK